MRSSLRREEHPAVFFGRGGLGFRKRLMVLVIMTVLQSVVSSLPQPLMAVPAYVSVQVFGPFLPCGLGFGAEALICMVFSELLPEAISEAQLRLVIPAVVLPVLVMHAC